MKKNIKNYIVINEMRFIIESKLNEIGLESNYIYQMDLIKNRDYKELFIYEIKNNIPRINYFLINKKHYCYHKSFYIDIKKEKKEDNGLYIYLD